MKGCQKKVIFLKNTGSYLFDEAYFIISSEGERSPTSEESMISEANRIIEDSIDNGNYSLKTNKIKKIINILLPFLSGALTASATILIWMWLG